MRLLSFFVSLSVVFGFFLLTMQIKGDVSSLISQRRQLAQEQQQLQEDLRVLKAEYAHLANLERLRILAEKMGLQPLAVGQLQNWDAFMAQVGGAA